MVPASPGVGDESGHMVLPFGPPSLGRDVYFQLRNMYLAMIQRRHKSGVQDAMMF